MVDIDLKKLSFLQRYPSEWDPRDQGKTKGGYIEGMILGVPQDASTMVLQTVPDKKYATMMVSDAQLTKFEPELVSSIHPLLLHVVRMGKGKRDNELEPVPNYMHWRQKFVIDSQRNVRIINRTSELDKDRNVPVELDDPRNIVTTIQHQNSIVLGGRKNELNLIALQPKTERRAVREEASVTKVLRDRLGTDDKNLLAAVEKYFKKSYYSNMKMFRLRADFYNELGHNIGFAISHTVKDTGNKKNGSMDIHDISVQRSCTKGGRKVMIESEYSLAKDVRPLFQVEDEFGNHLHHEDGRLNQPVNLKVRNYSIHIITPPQDENVINDLERNRKHIVLRFKRASDQYESPVSFRFRYDIHPPLDCIFCAFYPDTASEGELPRLQPGLENPRPNRIKRILKQRDHSQESKVMKMSPSSSVSSCSSPEYGDQRSTLFGEVTMDPEETFKLSPTSAASDSSSQAYCENDNHPKESGELKDQSSILPEISFLETLMADFDPINFACLENEKVPAAVEEDTLNTPEPMIESGNDFLFHRTLTEPVHYKTSSVSLELRGDVITDCAVTERKMVDQHILPRQSKPTQRVEPVKRWAADTHYSEQEEDEEEEKENPLLSIPLLVLALILLVIITSLLGLSPGRAVLVTSLSLGLAATYHFLMTDCRTGLEK